MPSLRQQLESEVREVATGIGLQAMLDLILDDMTPVKLEKLLTRMYQATPDMRLLRSARYGLEKAGIDTDTAKAVVKATAAQMGPPRDAMHLMGAFLPACFTAAREASQQGRYEPDKSTPKRDKGVIHATA